MLDKTAMNAFILAFKASIDTIDDRYVTLKAKRVEQTLNDSPILLPNAVN